jgi:hypothetical protein
VNAPSNVWATGETAAVVVYAYLAVLVGVILLRAMVALLKGLMRQSRRIVVIGGEVVAVAAIWPIEMAVDRAEQWAAQAIEWRAQRKIWRAEFRKVMPWAQFRLKMTGRGQPARDDYADALSLYGLAEPFTRQDMDARFKRVMRGVHPDAGGTDYLAQLATGARDLIFKRKGWKQ